MIKQIFALVAGLAIAAPASATSWQDIKRLETLIANTGTDVSAIQCERKGVYGYYQFDKTKDIDKIVICKNTVDMDDPDAVWETLAHEATHTMQACAGGPIVKDVRVPRVLRELQEFTPHYYRLLHQYSGAHKRVELEAFWMELRTPEFVMETFTKVCYNNNTTN